MASNSRNTAEKNDEGNEQKSNCDRDSDNHHSVYLFKIEIVHKSTQKYKNNKILSSKLAYPSPDTTQ